MNSTQDDASRNLTISRDQFFLYFLLLLAIALIGYTWNARAVMSPNDASRWDTIWSLVEYNTYEIFDTPDFGDKQQIGTIDKVLRRHDQKTISSKPPLLPTVMAGFMKVVRRIVGKPFSRDISVPNKPTIPGSINIYAKIGIWVFQIIPFLAVVWLYKRYLDSLDLSPEVWVISLMTIGLGTFVTGYLVTLNNHVIAATSGLAAAYHLRRILYDQNREAWRFAFLGFLVGWTAANELPAGLLAGLVSIVVLCIDWKKTLLCYAPTLALVTAGFFLTNYWAIGNPADPWNTKNFIPAYLQKDLYEKDASGEPSYWARKDKSGIDALNDHPEPLGLYALHSLVGHHGIFSLSPILIFALIGMGRSLGPDRIVPLVMTFIIIAVSIAVFAFYLLVSDQRNYGGFCHGLRWMQWLSLIWLLYLPVGVKPFLDSKAGRWLVGIALVVSIVSMFDTWYSPWSRSWLHRVLRFHDVIDY